MSKIVTICCSLLVAWAVAAGFAAEPTRPPLRANCSDWPPYFMHSTEADGLRGFGMDLLTLCAAEAGHGIDEHRLPLRRMLESLERGELDVQVVQRSNRPYLLYGEEAVFKTSYRLVVRADSELELESVTDLAGLTIGHLAGFERGYHGELEQHMARATMEGRVVTTAYEDGLFNLLLAGRIDGFVFTRASALWRARELGVLDRVEVLELELMADDEVFAVAKASTVVDDKQALLTAMDRCIVEARADGRYRSILRAYGLD